MIKRWFNSIDDIIATTALVLIIALTGTNVFSRHVLNNPLPWAEEITIGLFIWLVFIGISCAIKRNGHFGVDYFVNKLPRPFRLISLVLRAVAIYYVLLYILIYLGTNITINTNRITPILDISHQYINLAIPVGGLLATIHFTRIVIHSFQSEFGKGGGS